MGHTRLGSIPKSRKWSRVVESVLSENSQHALGQTEINVKQIASLAIDAAETGLTNAINDRGLQYTFYLLTQIILAAKSKHWESELQGLGIKLSPDGDIQTLTSEFHAATDKYIQNEAFSTDISEIAQRAAGETFLSCLSEDSGSLFESDAQQLRSQITKLSTKDGFAKVGQRFFGIFLGRFLNFYLSRVTAGHIGTGKMAQIGKIKSFNNILRQHCIESALIVKDFSGEWYSKTEYKEGINQKNSRGFVAVAIKKLQAELKKQEGSNV